jgi:hypothetical protein
MAVGAVTVWASPDELDPRASVWGSPDRALAPPDRWALDWITLCRFLGWDVIAETGTLADALGSAGSHLILARDPDRIGESEAEALRAHLEREPALVIAGAGPPGSALARLTGVATGELRVVAGAPRWAGPGPERSWNAHLQTEMALLDVSEGTVPWAFVGGAPLALARPLGAGVLVSLAADPSGLRDAGPGGTGVLRHLLLHGAPEPVAWLDLEGVVVLRMDDPGSAANVHLRGWAHPELGEADWLALAGELTKRGARMSACCVPGWIDDGDPERGELLVAGELAERVPAAVHPSPEVVFRERSGAVHDYVAEFRGLRAFRDAGVGELEQHGYTHVRPDRGRWAEAADRYENVDWYRELERLGPEVNPGGADDPIAAGRLIFRRVFGSEPSTLTCPGQACSATAAELAAAAGFELAATESLALRHGERLLWAGHVSCPGVDYPNPALLETGIPIQAILHDRDIALNGAEWLRGWLDAWAEAGVTRFIDFRELAGLLGVRVGLDDGGEVVTETRSGLAPVREVPIKRSAGAE